MRNAGTARRGANPRRRAKWVSIGREAPISERRRDDALAVLGKGVKLPAPDGSPEEAKVLFLISVLDDPRAKQLVRDPTTNRMDCVFGVDFDPSLPWVKGLNSTQLARVFDRYIHGIWNVYFGVFIDDRESSYTGWIFERA